MTPLLKLQTILTRANNPVPSNEGTLEPEFVPTDPEVPLTPPDNEDLVHLLEYSGESVTIYDRDFRYVYVNAEAERQIGLPRAELLGNAVWRLFPESVAPYWDTLLKVR
ncbi:MAG: PAS domain-containing protein, partial [Armatimonadota bacterium]